MFHVFLSESINKKRLKDMKPLKLWKGILMMYAAFTFTSCCQDEDIFDTNNLCGTWEQVYDKGVVSEGYIQYTFTPLATTYGTCSIHSYDVFAGDTTYQRTYTLTNDGHRLNIIQRQYGENPQTQEWDIQKLTSSRMTWTPVGRPDIMLNYEKVIRH